MIASWWKYAALGAAALFCLCVVAFAIYGAGYSTAEAKGKAALAALEKKYAEETAISWIEYAQKERAAKEELQAKQAKADALAVELLQTKSALAAERRGFAKRIADATRNNDYVLNPDTVRLYNEAFYGPAAAGREDSAGGAAGAAPDSRTPAPPGAALLPEQPVTIKDLLAHAKLYGEWAREVCGIAHGWAALVPE